MRKKKRIVFSVFNYLEESGKEVLLLQSRFKMVSAIVIGSTFITGNEHYSFLTSLVCAVINEVFCFLKVEEEIE